MTSTDYSLVLSRARVAARECGYAVAVHGSQTRDLDLIAVPWTTSAVDTSVLVEVIRKALGGAIEYGRDGRDPTHKPFGREAYAIHLGGELYVDLSVMPKTDTNRIAALEAELSTTREIRDESTANANRAWSRVGVLEAENAALKAERDAYRSQFWDNALPELTEMRKQRDANHAAFNVMAGCYKQALAERDSETRWAHYYFTAWQTARQSRARLVRLVLALRAELTTAWSIEAVAERECEEATTLYDCAKRYSDEMAAERDAAHAWAAAWRSCAHWWFYEPRETDRYWFKDSFAYQARKRREARRVAEAMERR